MKKNKAVVVILLCLIAVMLVSCSDRTELVVTGVDIKPNSFKASYQIDEQLNFDNIFILVTYDNGETTYIQCDQSMVEGFDTSTTGEKQLYVEYAGIQSQPVAYEVVYSKDNSKEILTSARLEYHSSQTNEIVSYTIKYFCGNLTNMQAIYFDCYSPDSLNINSDLQNVSFELPQGWSYSARWLTDNNIRMIFYNKDNDQGLDGNTVFRINVTKGNELAKVTLRDIEVSALEQTAVKYYIPDFER